MFQIEMNLLFILCSLSKAASKSGSMVLAIKADGQLAGLLLPNLLATLPLPQILSHLHPMSSALPPPHHLLSSSPWDQFGLEAS